jgi:hypothetical protein
MDLATPQSPSLLVATSCTPKLHSPLHCCTTLHVLRACHNLKRNRAHISQGTAWTHAACATDNTLTDGIGRTRWEREAARKRTPLSLTVEARQLPPLVNVFIAPPETSVADAMLNTRAKTLSAKLTRQPQVSTPRIASPLHYFVCGVEQYSAHLVSLPIPLMTSQTSP